MSTERDMQDRTVLVTGANAGIGRATATALAGRGARVLVHGRDAAKTGEAVAAIATETGGAVEPAIADFNDLAQVAALAREVRRRVGRLDVLVNNAGLIRDRLEFSADGIEQVFQVNHLAPFLLTRLLLPALRAAPDARVVTVASGAHGMAKTVGLERLARPERYDGMDVYARTKACNILFTRSLARRAAGEDVTAVALHPGVVRTAFAREGDVRGLLQWLFRLARPFMRAPEKGADTSVWLASTGEALENGGYYIDRALREPRAYARDDATAERLWALSEELVGDHLREESAP